MHQKDSEAAAPRDPFEKLRRRRADEVRKRAGRASAHREALLAVGPPLFRHWGIQKAVLFGSVARGRCSERSDLDLLVLPLRAESYWAFRRELEEALGVAVDLYTDGDDPGFLSRILERGETIYEA